MKLIKKDFKMATTYLMFQDLVAPDGLLLTFLGLLIEDFMI